MKLVEIELEEGLSSWQTDLEDTGVVAAQTRKRAGTNVSPQCETTSMSKAASREISQRDVKVLYALAGGRCAFETCKIELAEIVNSAAGPSHIGEMAHMVAHSNDGPRGDATYPRHKLNTYENLILLCPTHHAKIDDAPAQYPIELVREIKNSHERWVKISLVREIPNVDFRELDIIANAIASTSKPATQDLTLTAPLAKIQKNNLTESQLELTMGLSKAHEVAQYVDYMAAMDSTFPERLTAGFVNEYVRLQAAGLSGNLLFDELLMFAGGSTGNFKRKAAGLIVLTYLFERCEIFEK